MGTDPLTWVGDPLRGDRSQARESANSLAQVVMVEILPAIFPSAEGKERWSGGMRWEIGNRLRGGSQAKEIGQNKLEF